MSRRACSDLMGGAFGLELPLCDCFPHPESPYCAYVDSGRAALQLLLRAMPQRPRRVWVPRFACDTLLQPLRRLRLPVCRYEIAEDDLSPLLPDEAGEDDAAVFINYFGLAGAAWQQAVADFPGAALADATTALYAPPLPQAAGSFYSPRKFGGLCDGGVAVAPYPLALPTRTDRSSTAARALLLRTESGAAAALPATERAEARLNREPRRMSPLSRRLLRSIDWAAAARRRCANYRVLHAALRELNRLCLPEEPPSAPQCYPLVTAIPGLRDSLVDAGVALPLYWPEVIADSEASDSANRLARRLLPLPLDQRYDTHDMDRLLRLIRG